MTPFDSTLVLLIVLAVSAWGFYKSWKSLQPHGGEIEFLDL